MRMPQITVRTTSTRLAPQQRERLAQELAALMVDVLARKPESVLVGFESLDPQAWFAGGQAPAAGASLVQAHIAVVEGTGDAKAREQMLQRTTEALRQAYAPVHGPVYVLFVDVPAAAWGYNGRSVAALRAQG
jgi:phenylpyruvate tautomerase PptA (4-oxalocrotonate tautomerase family)